MDWGLEIERDVNSEAEVILITLPGTPPAKKNSRRRTKSGLSIPSKRYELWESMALAEILGKWQKAPVQRCQINCRFYIDDKRRKDLDNMVTSVLDMLSTGLIIHDDTWSVVWSISAKGFEADKAYTAIEILVED